MKRPLFYFLATICCILITGHSNAQLSLTFLDTETTSPIEDVLVTFEGGNILSDTAGRVELLPEITIIRVSRTGYISQDLNVLQLPSNIIYLQPDNRLAEIEIHAFPTGQLSGTSPASVSDIRRKELTVANQLDFSNVLNNVPGLHMQNGTLGTNRITIRGIGARTPFGTNKIRAYYNEIPLTAGDGETSLEDNELQMIGRITVVRGPSSTAYGAGLGGLIRLSPASIKENSISGTVGIGSFGLLRTFQHLQLSEGSHAFQVGFATTKSEGFRDNNQYERKNLLINYQYTGDHVTLDFLATGTGVDAQIPSSLNETDFNSNPELAAANWAAVNGFEDYQKGLFGLTFGYEFNEKRRLSTTVYTTFRDNYELRPFGILTESSILTGTRFKYTDRLNDNIAFVAGGEITNENYENTTLDQNEGIPADLTSFNSQDRNSVNFFLETSLILTNRLDMIAGLNFSKLSFDLNDLFRANGDQSGNYQFEGILSPRLLVNYEFEKNHHVYAQLSHGFSAPSVEETLTPEGIINPDISPEKGLSLEAGAKGRMEKVGFTYKFNFYRMIVNDLLVARRTAEDQFIGINAGKTSHLGTEVELNYQRKFSGILLDAFAVAAINEIKFVDFVDNGIDFSGNKLPGVPDRTTSVGLTFSTEGGLSLTSVFRMAGKMFLRDDNLQTTEAYGLLNLKAGYEKNFGKIFFSLYGGINNATDREYAAQILINAGSFGGRAPRYFYPGLPRNYFCSVSMRYKF